MGKEWTDEEVQKEIADAVQIVREDRMDAFLRSRFAPADDDKNGGKDKPPPSGNGPEDTPKKKSLWWGTEE